MRRRDLGPRGRCSDLCCRGGEARGRPRQPKRIPSGKLFGGARARACARECVGCRLGAPKARRDGDMRSGAVTERDDGLGGNAEWVEDTPILRTRSARSVPPMVLIGI